MPSLIPSPAPTFTTSEDSSQSDEVPSPKRSHLNRLRRQRTLVLNHQREAIGYPLMTFNFEDTIKALILGRVEIIELSPLWVHSPSISMRLPSIIALKEMVPANLLPREPVCNLHNLYVRDQGICQYTGIAQSLHGTEDLARQGTMEHILPMFRGGQTEWLNVVLTSSQSNGEKSNLLLWQTRFSLLHDPWVPTHQDLLYLWLTKYQVSEAEQPWLEFLRLVKPSDNVQRAMEKVAKLAA